MKSELLVTLVLSTAAFGASIPTARGDSCFIELGEVCLPSGEEYCQNDPTNCAVTVGTICMSAASNLAECARAVMWACGGIQGCVILGKCYSPGLPVWIEHVVREAVSLGDAFIALDLEREDIGYFKPPEFTPAEYDYLLSGTASQCTFA